MYIHMRHSPLVGKSHEACIKAVAFTAQYS